MVEELSMETLTKSLACQPLTMATLKESILKKMMFSKPLRLAKNMPLLRSGPCTLRMTLLNVTTSSTCQTPKREPLGRMKMLK